MGADDVGAKSSISRLDKGIRPKYLWVPKLVALPDIQRSDALTLAYILKIFNSTKSGAFSR